MIIGKVSSAPTKAYLRRDGKGFNLSLGGLSSEGNALSSIGGNGSNLGAHPFTSSTSLCSIMECRTPILMWSLPHPNYKQGMRGSSCETLSKYFCTT